MGGNRILSNVGKQRGRATSDFYLSNRRLQDKNYIIGARIYKSDVDRFSKLDLLTTITHDS
jgi:hypothetical protein